MSVEREAAFGVDPNGYVAFLATKNGLTMQRISSRGEISPATVLPVDIGGLQRLKTAFDGERHIVVWSTSANPKAVLVTPDGAVSDAFVIPTGSLPSVVLGVDARSGRSFVFFNENGGNPLYELSAVSIDDASRQAGVPFVVAHGVADELSIANVNDTLLLSWPYAGMNGQVLDRPTALPLSDAFPIARRAAEQNAPSIASGANVDLVVWSEVDTLNTMRVRARRINRAGIPLDPTPIELGTGDPNTIAPTVAYGEGEFLIAWGATQKISAQRIDETGHLLDPMPNVVSQSLFPSRLVYGGGVFFLVSTEQTRDSQAVVGIRISHGIALDPEPINISRTSTYDRADVAFDGERFVVAWTANTSRSYIGDPYKAGLSLTYVSPAGVVSNPILLADFQPYWTTPRVASNGLETVIAWDDFDFLQLTEFDRSGREIGQRSTVDTAGIRPGELSRLSWTRGAWLLLFEPLNTEPLPGMYVGVDSYGALRRKLTFVLPPDASQATAGDASIVYRRTVEDAPFSGAQAIAAAPLDVPAAAEPPSVVPRRRSARR